MICSLPMSGRQRRGYLQRQVEILDYIQARNAIASQSHRQATIKSLQRLGIEIDSLRCCYLE